MAVLGPSSVPSEQLIADLMLYTSCMTIAVSQFQECKERTQKDAKTQKASLLELRCAAILLLD